MPKSNPNGKSRPAAEWLAELMASPEYIAAEPQRQEFAAQCERRGRQYRADAAPILAELAQAGWPVHDFGELQSRGNYVGAVPVLARWLSRTDSSDIKMSIATMLVVPFAQGAATSLLAEFRACSEQPEHVQLKFKLGEALAAAAPADLFDDLVQLVQNPHHGGGRISLLAGLERLDRERAIPVLMAALADPQLTVEALLSLGRLKAVAAQPQIEGYLADTNRHVRLAAKQALAKLKPSRPRKRTATTGRIPSNYREVSTSLDFDAFEDLMERAGEVLGAPGYAPAWALLLEELHAAEPRESRHAELPLVLESGLAPMIVHALLSDQSTIDCWLYVPAEAAPLLQQELEAIDEDDPVED